MKEFWLLEIRGKERGEWRFFHPFMFFKTEEAVMAKVEKFNATAERSEVRAVRYERQEVKPAFESNYTDCGRLKGSPYEGQD